MRKQTGIVIAMITLIVLVAVALSFVISAQLTGHEGMDANNSPSTAIQQRSIAQLKQSAPQDVKTFLKKVKAGKYGNMVGSAKVGRIHGSSSEVIITVKERNWLALPNKARTDALRNWLSLWEGVHRRRPGKVTTQNEEGRGLGSVVNSYP